MSICVVLSVLALLDWLCGKLCLFRFVFAFVPYFVSVAVSSTRRYWCGLTLRNKKHTLICQGGNWLL